MNQLETQEEKSVRVFTTDTGEVKLSPSIVRQYLVNGSGAVTDQEVVMYLKLCEAQKLNPFIKEAYLIKYGDKQPATMVVSKDVFMKRAEKHPDFDGIESGVIVSNQNGIEYKQGAFYNKKTEEIVGAWAKVYRKSWTKPISVEVNFDEYVGMKKNYQTGQPEINGQWASKPATMIVKTAKAQALREAFTRDLQGMYDESEMNVTIEQQESQQIIEAEIFKNPLVINGVVVGEKSPERLADEEVDRLMEAEAEIINGEKPPF